MIFIQAICSLLEMASTLSFAFFGDPTKPYENEWRNPGWCAGLRARVADLTDPVVYAVILVLALQSVPISLPG
jgi:hypothetical protein